MARRMRPSWEQPSRASKCGVAVATLCTKVNTGGAACVSAGCFCVYRGSCGRSGGAYRASARTQSAVSVGCRVAPSPLF